MTDLSHVTTLPQKVTPAALALTGRALTALVLLGVALALLWATSQAMGDPTGYADTTLGELATWVAGQTTEAAPASWLVRVAQSRYDTDAVPDVVLAQLLRHTRQGLLGWTLLGVGLLAVGCGGLVSRVFNHTWPLLAGLVMLNTLVFIFPPGPVAVLALTLVTLISGALLAYAGDHLPKVVGFVVVLAFFGVVWEGAKAVADALNYQLAVATDGWDYTVYDDTDAALAALERGDVGLVLADRNTLRDLMLEGGSADDPAATAYPGLRYLTRINKDETRYGRPLLPALPGRSAVALPAGETTTITALQQLAGHRVAVPAGDFVVANYLDIPRQVVLYDMRIANDLNLPHLQSIAEALLQPARRNGPQLLVGILFDAALYTWTEAILGFVIGATLGFVLGSVFAHVALLQRSLLPYVIASQTIPIIAIAPMVVIWLRDSHPLLPVAVISAYLTFFPVTVNTLRGLQSPDPTAFALMRSFAANRWQVMWKLRFPAALPFIFTALKVSATASVVGAIIGELPSGIRNGLGRAILDFSSDYSLISTPKLWAAIFMSALVGITFFLIVAGVERLALRGR